MIPYYGYARQDRKDEGRVPITAKLVADIISRAGADLTLTATEFEVLRFLMQNPRHVLTKGQILERVWRYDFGGQTNVVELYISYLRRKIEAGRPPMIHTVRGVGYVLKPND